MIGLQYGVSRRAVPAVSAPTAASGWVRPADWLPLPTVAEGEQRLVALVAVYPHESNHLSMVCSGNYTVDWGDGTVQNFSANTQANRNYVYSSIPANDTSRGYRQVILTITPQSGQSLTSINFSVRHPQASNVAYSHKLLDLRCAGAQISSLNASGGATNATLLERFEFVGSNLITNFANFLVNCYYLQSIPRLDTSRGTNFTSFLFNCYSLQSIPLLNTSQGISFNNFLFNCNSLQSIPLLDTSRGTNFASFLFNCNSLQSIPLLDTSQGTNFTNFLGNCYALQSVPLLNTSQGTNFTNFLGNCYALQSVPLLNTSQGTNFTNFLSNCNSLQSIPLLNTSQGTNFTNFLINCNSLQSIPLLDTSQGTNFANFLGNCNSLALAVLQGQKETVSLANLSLGRQALIDLFNGLATVMGKTLTISGNYGAALLSQTDRNIAINKGWILVG